MDEKKQSSEGTERDGPLSRLVEEEVAGSSASTEVEKELTGSPDAAEVEKMRHRVTRVEPSPGRADYSKGTSEHDDDRED